ncbi:unnamed protein product, partial [Adineta steineri]
YIGINPRQTVRRDSFNWLGDTSNNSNSATRGPKLTSYVPTFGEQKKRNLKYIQISRFLILFSFIASVQQTTTTYNDWHRFGQ